MLLPLSIMMQITFQWNQFLYIDRSPGWNGMEYSHWGTRGTFDAGTSYKDEGRIEKTHLGWCSPGG